MIIALAGHVDHGKTSLIRALTGVETDRLQQEVERGLTIDLGFAYSEIEGQRIGFVDVPGHHRFVHNMLAGISGHQCALLVIAADDGVMPQTREHLSIMQLLGLQRGLVVINKVDRVSEERLQAVRVEIAAALADSFLADADVLPVSATAGSGIAELKRAIAALADPDSGARKDAPDTAGQQHCRLPIDRAFSYRGVGTIVTGTLHTGSMTLDQTVTLFPGNRSSRVRSLRANDQPAEQARAGDRVAVNLAGVDASDVQRGMWLQSGNAA
ncbi:MAG: selenocysteine-specific translation elongation factor, partial [Pseudomonadales bacterium]